MRTVRTVPWCLGALVPVPVPVLVLVLAGCSYMPAQREIERAREAVLAVDEVADVQFSCGGGILAGDRHCMDLTMKDGAKLRFEHIGFNAFTTNAVNVYVAEAAGLVPRIASCDSTTAPNFHRQSPLGHHFQPTLIDVKDAVFRYKEILEEVTFWPQCPQYWETQDRQGRNYRYCAKKRGAAEEPPRPECG